MLSDMAMWWVLHSSAWIQYDGDTANRYLKLSPKHKLAAHCSGWARAVQCASYRRVCQSATQPCAACSYLCRVVGLPESAFDSCLPLL